MIIVKSPTRDKIMLKISSVSKFLSRDAGEINLNKKCKSLK